MASLVANDRQPTSDTTAARSIEEALRASVAARETHTKPYPHFFLTDVFPGAVADALLGLPAPVADVGDISGKRELHNDTRRYFDTFTIGAIPVVAQVAEALQASETVRLLADAFDAPLDGTFLRIEDARDVDGFWLEPHTDLGVKKFTCLIYLAHRGEHASLGTDIYASKDRHVGRSSFRHNAAMVFVPAADTWHGFEKRPIQGVRRSIIVNYVSADWREKRQLAFPEQPVRL